MAYKTSGGSVEFTRSVLGTWTGRVEKWEDRTKAKTALPAKGEAYGGDEEWAAATLRDVVVRESPTSNRRIIILTYSNAPFSETALGGGNPAESLEDDTPVFMADSFDEDIPFWRHPNYKTIWDHDLYVRISNNDTYESPLADYATRTTTELTEVQAKTNLWVKAGGMVSSPDGEDYRWGLYKKMIKPGTSSFRYKAPVIVETRYFPDDAAAGAFAMGSVGTLLAPAKTFNLSPATNNHFLVTSGPVRPDGQRWVAERRYVWSKIEWDGDLYPIPGA